ncbi:MAG: GlmU family protein [Flavobacteriaceae bacterium]|nr:GlmU family protein [Flavobacteriaceae bacterium]
MKIILVDQHRTSLLPFTYTRPIAAIRVGILSIAEKWEKLFQCEVGFATEEYLSQKYPSLSGEKQYLFVNASYLPNEAFLQEIKALNPSDYLVDDGEVVAYKASEKRNSFTELNAVALTSEVISIKHTWDIFSKNHDCIQADFKLLTKNRTSAKIPKEVLAINAEQIFIEEGAKLYNGSLNASEGPIYIGKNAEIMENCSVRGPFSLGDYSTLKMGAKIYTGTTIGPHSKVGGEVSNSVLFGYANKGHDGFLGNSVLGEWVNIGADSNTSNLKNNYASVRLWNYAEERFADTGLQFCGLLMGDHSKCGINTMFNTGTVIGVSTNIFGAGFPRNFIPSFSWGGSAGTTTYKTNKAFEVAKIVMARRKIEFSKEDEQILLHVFDITSKYRR